jgi:hypothetical protein
MSVIAYKNNIFARFTVILITILGGIFPREVRNNLAYSRIGVSELGSSILITRV